MQVSEQTAILHDHERESTTDRQPENFCKPCGAWFRPVEKSDIQAAHDAYYMEANQ